MRLDIANRAGVDPCLRETVIDDSGLGDGTGNHRTARRSPVICGCAFDDRVDVVIVCDGPPCGFQHHDSDAFPRNVTVSTFTKGLATTVGRVHVQQSAGDVFVRMQ